MSWTCKPCGTVNPSGMMCAGCHQREGVAIPPQDECVIPVDAPLPQEKIKLDDGKIDWSLLPFDALEEVVQVLAWAASGKYARESWRFLKDDPKKGPVDVRALRSALRHLISDVALHEQQDPETGYQHIAHAACQLLFALAHRRMKKEGTHP